MSKVVQHRFLLQFLEADGTIKTLVLTNLLNSTNLLAETMGATLMDKRVQKVKKAPPHKRSTCNSF